MTKAQSSDLRPRIGRLIERLDDGLFEREEAVRLCLLSALAQESVFLLGPPGVAKSLIARRLKHVFPRDARAFEYLMNRFSTPDEIFGPVSIRSLKDDDELVRKTDDYLPGATVVFLDEIWKAGPSIQNTLLTVINERVFRNAGRDEPVALRALISASNELPAEDAGLEALWDRFLVRLVVENVKDPASRHGILRSTLDEHDFDVPDEDRFADDELTEMGAAIDRVEIPDDVLFVIDEIIDRIEEYNRERGASDELEPGTLLEDPGEGPDPIYVSDRRWKKIGRLLRTSAHLNGRERVDLSDCFLIPYCIWGEPDHREAGGRMVSQAVQAAFADRRLAGFERDWQAMKAELAELPSTSYRPPMPFRGYYLLDLSENRALLTVGSGEVYDTVPKDVYEALRKRFQKLRLSAGEDGPAVELKGRLGRSPAEVVLKNEVDGPLRPFGPTAFPFQVDEDAEAVEVLSKDEAERFVAGARKLQRKIGDARKALGKSSGDSVAGLSVANLFISLPAERRAGLERSAKKLAGRLARIATDVDRFLKEKELA